MLSLVLSCLIGSAPLLLTRCTRGTRDHSDDTTVHENAHTSGYCTFPSTSWNVALIQKTTGRCTDRPYRAARQHRSPDAHTPRISLLPMHPEIPWRLGITHVVSAIQADVSKHFDRRILVIHVPIKDIPNAEHRGVARLRRRVDRKSAG